MIKNLVENLILIINYKNQEALYFLLTMLWKITILQLQYLCNILALIKYAPGLILYINFILQKLWDLKYLLIGFYMMSLNNNSSKEHSNRRLINNGLTPKWLMIYVCMYALTNMWPIYQWISSLITSQLFIILLTIMILWIMHKRMVTRNWKYTIIYDKDKDFLSKYVVWNKKKNKYYSVLNLAFKWFMLDLAINMLFNLLCIYYTFFVYPNWEVLLNVCPYLKNVSNKAISIELFNTIVVNNPSMLSKQDPEAFEYIYVNYLNSREKFNVDLLLNNAISEQVDIPWISHLMYGGYHLTELCPIALTLIIALLSLIITIRITDWQLAKDNVLPKKLVLFSLIIAVLIWVSTFIVYLTNSLNFWTISLFGSDILFTVIYFIYTHYKYIVYYKNKKENNNKNKK